MLEGSHLFLAHKLGALNNEQHLAEMVSLIGPPPLEFLQRSPNCHIYWDERGVHYFLLFSFSAREVSSDKQPKVIGKA